jgi:tRNA-binding EMAP/Myf-like protein
MIRRIIVVIALILLVGGIGITFYVERESEPKRESISRNGEARAPVLYHPSRDAGFSDEISLATAQGLKDAGFAVDRETTTSSTPAKPQGYTVIAVVANTFWFQPDRPTLRYLARARLDGVKAIGLICGAGSTDRSERLLSEALKKTGANLVETRSYWISRPNDETRIEAQNRDVAIEKARAFGLATGRNILAANATQPAPRQ